MYIIIAISHEIVGISEGERKNVILSVPTPTHTFFWVEVGRSELGHISI